MSATGIILHKKYIKITSMIESDDYDLIGKIFLADYVLHIGEGEYSCQVWHKGRIYICTSCRIRFLTKEKYPEYYL